MYEDLDAEAKRGISWDSIGSSMDAFAGMAASGGFEVNQSGGDALLKAIRSMREWANEQQLGLRDLAQRMPLGGSNAAQVIAPYAQQVAVDGQGFLTQLKHFNDSLAKAEEGINKAMANYKATEQANRAALGRIEPV
ncbi:hypothetical protein [Kibdelosporangium phytohabitans]|uniref:PE domain-containing protein n=1 Tax=Kibdelosporangium phytohabitans TaxID=860235 RepID=A0A0N9HXQ4_9PSEU|nr:hypothetical protein [Kibdelosporangium phytohabitans]ALG08045.1 hypothetical protein AOZ06_14960 [Kibdelosporangium phytohabitans]MBE1470993.1 hypothetical protein [Kibdelosporangium phytohabitans]